MSCLQIIKIIVEIGFYVVGISVAIWGFHSWRRQLRGKTEYGVARAVLTGAYRFRDAMRQTQAPFMSGAERSGYERKDDETDKQAEVASQHYAYSKRFESVIQKQQKLYGAMIDAEALFGKDAREAIESLFKVGRLLGFAIEIYFKALYQKENTSTDFFRKQFNIIYGTGALDNSSLPSGYVDDGGFSNKFNEALEYIEAYFKKYVENRNYFKNTIDKINKPIQKIIFASRKQIQRIKSRICP